MGFFKKFFSIGSRKSKKRSAVIPGADSLPLVQEHLKSCQVDDTEAQVSRLLRSSSARYAAKPQSSLPPFPHPIDSVIRPPKSSTTTIASVSARSTYSVTVHGRTVHSRTEFPNAYPPMDVTPKRALTDSPRRRSKSAPITPRDKSRLLLLRQDPSVANLVHYYDDEGHLKSILFSNSPSPQKQGRVQRRRTGSTFRQLLGHPSSPDLRNAGTEGDISWAERFLGETDGNSSVSSIGPMTPLDTHSIHTPSVDDKTALSIECDTLSPNHHTFSSLEVELSVSTDLAHPQGSSSPYGNSMTPRRASQIFGFLGDKKRVDDSPVSRLPQPRTTTPHVRRFSAESTISDTKHSHIPVSRRATTHIPQLSSPVGQRHFSFASDMNMSPRSPTAAVFLPRQPEDEEPTFPQSSIPQRRGHNTRGPRGSHVPSRIPSRQSTGPASVPCDFCVSMEQPLSTQSVLGEKLNTADNHCITVAPARPREILSQIPKLRTASGSSSSSTGSNSDLIINSPRQHSIPFQPTTHMKEVELSGTMTPHGKENDTLSRLPQPVTPVRPFGLHHLREPASPASSSELSPVAKQMMANLRQQRMHARQRERQAGRLGSSQSRIRY